MTTVPHHRDLPPLLTDADVLARVEMFVGSATGDRTLWLFLIDGDRRQAPVVVPLEGVPHLPDDTVDGVGRLLEQFVPELATDAGPGSVVFVSERFGPHEVVPADRDWAEALERACLRAGVVSRGTYASTRSGVLRVR